MMDRYPATQIGQADQWIKVEALQPHFSQILNWAEITTYQTIESLEELGPNIIGLNAPLYSNHTKRL